MLKPTFKLTGEQIEFFETEGYLTIDALTTPEDIAFLRKSYDRIFQERSGWKEGNQFDLGGTDEEGTEAVLPQILDPARYAPEMKESLLFSNANFIAVQLFGNKAKCSFFHAIFKPAHTGAETPWHQDAAYWDSAFYHHQISIWVPLQETTLENGSMQFVPRSHQWDVLTHQSINNNPRIHGLELHPCEMDKVKTPVVCPLPPGGATVHGGYILHYSGPNRTNTGRRALIISAIGKPKPRKNKSQFWWLDEKKTARSKRAGEL